MSGRENETIYQKKETYVVIKLGDKFNIEEEDGSSCQFLGDNIKEDLRAIVFVVFVRTLLALASIHPHLYEGSPVSEEYSFST